MSEGGEKDYTLNDLLNPFVDYNIEILCLQLAENNAYEAEKYYNEWELSKIYEYIALKLALNYTPKKD